MCTTRRNLRRAGWRRPPAGWLGTLSRWQTKTGPKPRIGQYQGVGAEKEKQRDKSVIERLNFYGLYGYLLPGAVLLSLLWFPFGLLLGFWPEFDWKAAGLILLFAYILGHVLHALSEAAFPTEIADERGEKFYPSDLMVDQDGDELLPQLTRLGQPIKQQLQTRIQNQFNGLNIEVNRSLSTEFAAARNQTEPERSAALAAVENLKRDRRTAFFKCRSYLIQIGAAPYAEQHQAMYALMRGVAGAFILAFALYFGLAVRLQPARHSLPPSVFGFLAALFIALVFSFRGLWVDGWRPRWPSICPRDEQAARRSIFWLLAFALACGAFAFGDISRASAAAASESITGPACHRMTNQVTALQNATSSNGFQLPTEIRIHTRELIWSVTIITLLFSLICLSEYRGFAANFAATIYRDFSNTKPPNA